MIVLISQMQKWSMHMSVGDAATNKALCCCAASLLRSWSGSQNLEQAHACSALTAAESAASSSRVLTTHMHGARECRSALAMHVMLPTSQIAIVHITQRLGGVPCVRFGGVSGTYCDRIVREVGANRRHRSDGGRNSSPISCAGWKHDLLREYRDA